MTDSEPLAVTLQPRGLSTVNVPGASPAGHYSHITKYGDIVYVSGQLPIPLQASTDQHGSFEDQARLVFENMDSCLMTAGSSRERLLSVTVYLSNLDNWDMFDRLYGSWLGRARPARTVVAVERLHYGLAVEMSATAAVE